MEIIHFGKGIIHLDQDVQTTPKRWFDVEHIILRFNFNVVQINWCALTYKKIPHYLRVYQGWKYGLCMGWIRKVTKFLPQNLEELCSWPYVKKWWFQNVSPRSIMAESWFLFFLWTRKGDGNVLFWSLSVINHSINP